VTLPFLLRQWRYAIVLAFLVTAIITPGDVMTAHHHGHSNDRAVLPERGLSSMSVRRRRGTTAAGGGDGRCLRSARAADPRRSPVVAVLLGERTHDGEPRRGWGLFRAGHKHHRPEQTPARPRPSGLLAVDIGNSDTVIGSSMAANCLGSGVSRRDLYGGRVGAEAGGSGRSNHWPRSLEAVLLGGASLTLAWSVPERLYRRRRWR
jgi:hypothetical protein